VEKLQLVAIELSARRLQGIKNAGVNDSRQKVVQNDPLVVKANNLLDRGETSAGVVVHHAIVETKKKALEL
jgi:hypothetical protein